MRCEHCGKEMSVVGLEMLNDNTECRQTFACTNKNCANYAGRDLNSPLHCTKGCTIKL